MEPSEKEVITQCPQVKKRQVRHELDQALTVTATSGIIPAQSYRACRRSAGGQRCIVDVYVQLVELKAVYCLKGCEG